MASDATDDAVTDWKQVQCVPPVRDYIHDQVRGEDRIMSQFVDEVLPPNWEDVEHGHEIAYIKVTPDVDERVNHMAGNRVRKGEVVAFYCLVHALSEGDFETAQEMVQYIPEALWQFMEGQA